jgi:hypothetical protein
MVAAVTGLWRVIKPFTLPADGLLLMDMVELLLLRWLAFLLQLPPLWLLLMPATYFSLVMIIKRKA